MADRKMMSFFEKKVRASRRAFALGFALAVCLSWSGSLWSQPTGYANTRIKVRCGILLLQSTASFWARGVPTNADPYVFYNLERRQDLRPPSWEFENPLAPGTVTPEIKARWDAIVSGTGQPQYQLGQRLTKNMAAYWEVDLAKLSSKAITQYDVLLIHAPNAFSDPLSLNPEEREKLRAFMDAGGILWFDKATLQTMDPINGFPVAFQVTSAGTNPRVVQPFHPLLNFPYRLGGFESAYMGSHRGRHAIIRADLASVGLSGYEGVFSPIGPDFDRINPVIANSAGVVVGVAPIGNGFFVVTSNNVVSRINEPAGGGSVGIGGNSGPYAGENFLNIPVTELKFAYNVIGLAMGFSAQSKGNRRLNASFEPLGAPLLENWVEPSLSLSQGDHTTYVPPALFKGLVFVTAGTRLYAFKADPSRDLDLDGLTDDGFQDASIGATRDLVWQSVDLPAPLSPPTAVEVAGSSVRDQVYVVDGAGNLHVFQAFPRGANGRLLGPSPIAPVATISPPSPPVISGPPNRGPYAPLFLDGLVYVYDTYVPGFGQRRGRVWVADAFSFQPVQTFGRWVVEGNTSPPLPEPSGPGTIGTIRIDDVTSGVDYVLYVPHRSELTGTPVGVSSIWIGAKGESPVQVDRLPTSLQITTRASLVGLRLYVPGGASPFGVRISLVEDTGRPLTPSEVAAYLDGTITQFAPGRLNLGLRQPLPLNIGVRVDYFLDWGAVSAGGSNRFIRGQLFFPDDIQRQQYVVKSMALAPNGNLFVTTSNEDRGGSLYCIREETRGRFRLLYRWDLHDGFRVALNNTTLAQVPPVIEDRDDLWPIFFPSANPYPRLTRIHFHGNPVIHRDICYVTVSAVVTRPGFPFGFGQNAYILAFDADPKPREIRLNGPVPSGLRLRQPDISASNNKFQPERFVVAQQDQIEILPEAGIIRFDNLMAGTSGPMRNAFSTSMPVIISGNGIPESLFDPNTTGSRWSPLLWYFGVQQMMTEAPPLVMGDTIYAVGTSLLPGFLQNPPIFRPQGVLFAMDSEIPPNDPSIITIPGQPGLKQVRWIIADSSMPMGFRANPHVRWPSSQGVQSFDDFRTRLSQTVLRFSNEALGVIGGEGTLIAWGEVGLYGFNRGATLVADEGRIVEVDSGGFALWASDTSFEWFSDGNTNILKSQKLQRPTKVYRVAEREFAVVDTGANRIVRIDKSAGEVRTLERLLLDPTYRPVGWNEGDPLDLRQPRDVAVWVDLVPQANNPLSFRAPVELWVHYLIADTGNRRLIELIDRYVANNAGEVFDVVRDTNGVPQLGVLFWHTPADLSGKRWQYTAIKRFQIGVDPSTGNARFVYVAGIGDMMPTAENTGLAPPTGTGLRETGGGPGGLVVFDPNGNQVVNEFVLPNGSRQRIVGVSSVSVRATGIQGNDLTYAIMFADQNGVYEITDPDRDGVWTTLWMLPNSVYESIRGVKLRAVSAQRLLNGQVLITNASYGSTASGATFLGEVTQWRDDYNPALPNLGFTTNSVIFELPPVVGTRGLRLPQFAIRQ
jgi:hypothetical protein